MKRSVMGLAAIALCTSLLGGCGNATLVTSTPVSVYAQSEAEEAEKVEETAETPLEEIQEAEVLSPYQQVGKKESILEYHAPMAYVLEYPIVGMGEIDVQIKEMVSQMRSDFDTEYAPEDTRSNRRKHQKDCDTILYLTYESYLNEENQILTVVFHETFELSTMANLMERKTAYYFDMESGERLDVTPYHAEEYKEIISKYVLQYFEADESIQDRLFGNYREYLQPDAEIFNTIALTDEGLIIYIPKYEVLPGSFGETRITLSFEEIEGLLAGEAQEIPEVAIAEEEAVEKELSDAARGALGPNRTIDPTKPMVALTFDDGPHPVHTEAILDTLESYGAVATFFDLGTRVQTYPDTARREVAIGCEVGSHSLEHKRMTKLSDDGIISDMTQTDEIFNEVLGYKPSLFRPPYGEIDERVKGHMPMSAILWSIDTRDWESKNADKIMEHIRSQGDLDGDVILMHGIYESSAVATEMLIPYLLEEGYQIVTVSELLTYHYETTPTPHELYGYSFFR